MWTVSRVSIAQEKKKKKQHTTYEVCMRFHTRHSWALNLLLSCSCDVFFFSSLALVLSALFHIFSVFIILSESQLSNYSLNNQ